MFSLHVDFQLTTAFESFSTRARKRPLSCVRSNVDCELAVEFERSPTCCTSKRRLARVRPHVAPQLTAAYETFSTRRAKERLLARVGSSNVNLQFAADRKRFSTRFAEVRFLASVGSSHVNRQLLGHSEIPPTCQTRKRLFPCVGPYVPLQRGHVVEFFPTGVARILFLPSVDS